jgi:DNA-directed RNA polymerase subunit F
MNQLSKLLFVLCFFLSGCALDTISKDGCCSGAIYGDSGLDKDLVQNAHVYMDYLEKLGKTSPQNVNKVSHPFAESVQKTINDKKVAGNAQEFVKQLADVRKLSPSWTIEILEVLPSSETRAATIRYKLEAAPFGAFIIIVIVHFTETGTVLDVNEVYSQLEHVKK